MSGAEKSDSTQARPWARVAAALLIKFAKHLVVLACLLIIKAATSPGDTSELAIFFIVVAAAAMYSVGRSFERRFPPVSRLASWRP